jgi:signal transduction histidine kinase
MTDINNIVNELQNTKIAYQQSLQNSRFKAGFLGRIAHEIRSPLSSLIGLHQLIINDLCESQEEEREFIEDAYNYAKKLMGILDRLITVSKLEVGKVSLDIQRVDIVELLTDIQEIMTLQAKNRNLKLTLAHIKENIITPVDRTRLTDALLFLLEVVIDYGEMGEIKLNCHQNKENQTAVITIDFPCQHLSISEDIDLVKSPIQELKQLNSLPQLSSGMKIMLAESLLESMAGKLIFNANEENNLTRWQLFLPLDTL